MKVLILTPLFFGDSSGAAVYYKILANSFIQSGYAVSVISDKEEGDFQGVYHDVFPVRCGREKRKITDILSYAVQNLKYFLISSIIKQEQATVLLVHSSFYNHPGIFALVMNRIRKQFPNLKMVLDVRDRLVPLKQIKELGIYNEVIACSENVKADLIGKGIEDKSINLIPVIQEKFSLDESSIDHLLASLGITKPYIYYAGLIKESKSVDLLLDAYVNYIQKQKPGITLVISGLIKTENEHVLSMLNQEGVLYVGNRSRAEVLLLIKGADVCVNLSPNEGMPRSSLEALALGTPVVLPPNVPEFSLYCPASVNTSSCPKYIAEKILEIQQESEKSIYPIESHFPENVLPKYIELVRA